MARFATSGRATLGSRGVLASPPRMKRLRPMASEHSIIFKVARFIGVREPPRIPSGDQFATNGLRLAGNKVTLVTQRPTKHQLQLAAAHSIIFSVAPFIGVRRRARTMSRARFGTNGRAWAMNKVLSSFQRAT